MKKMVHCVFYSKAFIPQQIVFLNQWFPEEEQIFFVYGACKDDLSNAPGNVYRLDKYDQPDFIAEALNARKVIFNDLFEEIAIALSRYPEIVTKGVWIPWGPDIDNRQEYRKESLQKQMGMIFYRQFVRWLYGIATPIQGDYIRTKSLYQTPARYIDAGAIVYAFEHSDLEHIIIARRHRDFTTIQLGNSADPSNHHREMLEWLTPFKEKKCRIYAPLSYHSKKHAQEVIHRGKALFRLATTL